MQGREKKKRKNGSGQLFVAVPTAASGGSRRSGAVSLRNARDDSRNEFIVPQDYARGSGSVKFEVGEVGEGCV